MHSPAKQQGDEFLLMGLRLAEGIEIARYEALSGRRLARERITDLESAGIHPATRAGPDRRKSGGFSDPECGGLRILYNKK